MSVQDQSRLGRDNRKSGHVDYSISSARSN
jgi:hypothetical protein